MKRILLVFITSVFLVGCLGPEKVDATNDETLKRTTQLISQKLPESDREEFGKAIVYFSMGGTLGFEKIMGAAFSGEEVPVQRLLQVNLSVIDGLTGEQVIDKYRSSLKEQKEIIAERRAINKLKADAQEFLKQSKFEQALAKYDELSHLPSALGEAEKGIANTTIAMEEFSEKINYLDSIEITEFVAKRIDTYSGKKVPAVRISLKNNGDRSLDKVLVTVYFQDVDGKTIYEKNFTPVLVSKFSFRDSKPLKAGYVREMESDKYYTVDSPLSEWSEGKATIKITDIEFTE